MALGKKGEGCLRRVRLSRRQRVMSGKVQMVWRKGSMSSIVFAEGGRKVVVGGWWWDDGCASLLMAD